MSRKHFQALADHIKFAVVTDQVRDQFITLAAEFCKSQNGRFDADRFRKACEPTEQLRKVCA
jgi:hypothetical protein